MGVPQCPTFHVARYNQKQYLKGDLFETHRGHCVVSFFLRTGLTKKVMKCPDMTERLLTGM